MKNLLSLIMMMLLAVCVTSCGSKYARPDRCVCEMTDPAPVVAPVPEPEPVKEIKQAIQEAVKEEKKEFTIDFEKLSKQSLFEFNSDKIAEDNYAGLDVVAEFLKETPNVSVKIEGHTDNIGTKEYNQKLSERRAKSVANYLINKGVDSSKITTEGFGFSKPIASNKTAEGRAKNRRTEMKFTINGEEQEPVVLQEESGKTK
ncbi:MAG: OmpA family protein [Elusimicrobia bacterium]|nr:OmpA family protein [Elusimicrobiota bacterium]